jgi:RHS repeat-associated protein
VQQIRAGGHGQDDGSIAHFDYGFDALGNLTSRYDAFGAYTEYFCYDPLNRLTASALGGAGCTAPGGTGTAKTVAYDDIGNITARSGLGAYSYAAPGGALPHAVSAIAGTVNGIINPHYKYDLNGNLVCVYTGTSCIGSGIVRESDTWWSFNMAKTLSEGTARIDLAYGPEHDRITQTASNGSTSTTTTYLNDPVTGAMSEAVVTGGIATWNDYLSVDGRLVAERSCSGAAPCSGSGSAVTWSYVVTDHLGSVAVVTDATGAVTTNGRMSFDPWGRQRNADGSDDATCALPQASPTSKGFTGQEAIASLCLVNLNARLYDPTLGRFLSPDSIVGDPTDAQSYNRYSYVNNRPLSLTDPTGHQAGDPFISRCGYTCLPSVTQQPIETAHGDANRFPDSAMLSPIYPALNAMQRHWVQTLTGIGAWNINVGLNANGNAALRFTCSGGDAACITAGGRPGYRGLPDNQPRFAPKISSARGAWFGSDSALYQDIKHLAQNRRTDVFIFRLSQSDVRLLAKGRA